MRTRIFKCAEDWRGAEFGVSLDELEVEPEISHGIDTSAFASEFKRRLINYGRKKRPAWGAEPRKDFAPEQIQAAVDIATNILKRLG